MVLPPGQQPPPPWNYYYPPNLTDFLPKANIVIQFTAVGLYTQEVTTQVPHQYLDNLVVKFFNKFGNVIPQLFGPSFKITVTSPTTFTIPFQQPFTIAVPVTPTTKQPFQVVPVAEVGQSLQSAINNAA